MEVERHHCGGIVLEDLITYGGNKTMRWALRHMENTHSLLPHERLSIRAARPLSAVQKS
jgi:hypothetical protein